VTVAEDVEATVVAPPTADLDTTPIAARGMIGGATLEAADRAVAVVESGAIDRSRAGAIAEIRSKEKGGSSTRPFFSDVSIEARGQFTITSTSSPTLISRTEV
jgi:hypothetical protein